MTMATTATATTRRAVLLIRRRRGGGGGGPALRASVPRARGQAALFSTATTPPTASPSRAVASLVRLPGILPRPQQQQQQQRPTVAAGRAGGIRWSSDSSAPAGSKIWSFEEIDALTKSQSQPQPQSQSPGKRRQVTIIDVREPGELAQTGRIPGALNVPVASAPDSFHLGADEFEERFGFARPGPGDEVLFYCKAGVRSRAAAGLARDAGWGPVGEYPGSWVDWVGRGGKVER